MPKSKSYSPLAFHETNYIVIPVKKVKPTMVVYQDIPRFGCVKYDNQEDPKQMFIELTESPTSNVIVTR